MIYNINMFKKQWILSKECIDLLPYFLRARGEQQIPL
jgi:hypothetical protein